MDQHLTSKALVAHRFARSSSTYDRAAVVQQDMARQMVRMIQQVAGADQFENVLELGCGTGLLTELLVRRFRMRHLTLNDLVTDLPGVARRCSERQSQQQSQLQVRDIQFTFCPGDMESIELPADQDLVASNAVLQWATNPSAMLARMTDAVRPGGLLAVATFGPDNLRETRDLTGASLDYLSLDALRSHLDGRAHVLACYERTRTVSFASAYAMLQHLKRTGVNGLRQRSWTPRAMREFCSVYESRFRSGDRVPLTYHPMTVIARRQGI